uniref:PDZ domain-containing protein n=1 Tax=Glossina austeni TaxID=7395 RepID=A0A1A9VSN7_GLOAU
MATPIEEKVDQNLKIRTGMVNVSDGKCKPEPLRLNLTMELLTLQRLEIVTPTNPQNGPPSESKERMVQITRQKQGGLGLSIKGGAEHKLPILISRIYKDQAADITGQLFVGDAIIKVNGEYITACPHDDAVNILRNAGDIVVLTVKHYRAATPFLQKQLAKDTPDSDNDTTCAELKADEGYKSSVNNGGGGTISRSCSRPMSICSEPEKRWMDVVAVPLMMAYVTRYIYGTDKLRPNAFEVRGINGTSTGIIHCDDLAILSQWLKLINDNVVGLTHLQMKLYNRNFAVGERIEYMGWVNEGVINNNISWQSYKPRFLLLKGTEVMLFETPPRQQQQQQQQRQQNPVTTVVACQRKRLRQMIQQQISNCVHAKIFDQLKSIEPIVHNNARLLQQSFVSLLSLNKVDLRAKFLYSTGKEITNFQ